MDAPNAEQRFVTLDEKAPLADYNYGHFRTEHLIRDAKRTLTDRGIMAGETAPDCAMARVDSGTLRLSALCGRPVLLRFGPFT
ncbi:MAG: hypothetical protein IT338_05740 [Thermomicrobiales bacterium]|nr:hypothetical protein [Thermomicrobiales bacterium]